MLGRVPHAGPHTLHWCDGARHARHARCAGGQRYDFLSRFFGPWMGIAEDPVCGSAHCLLAPYWASRLDRRWLRARQCSPRGGDLLLEVQRAQGRVVMSGQATLVCKGQMLLPGPACGATAATR